MPIDNNTFFLGNHLPKTQGFSPNGATRAAQPQALAEPQAPAAFRQDANFGPAATVEISPEGRAAYAAMLPGGREEIPMPGQRAGDAQEVGGKECQTCKNRKYVDGSDDASVSFQQPTHVDPGQAGSAVAAHENEHVNHEQVKAKEEGRKVVNQTVSIHTSVCPECGRVYVSGGTTTTETAKDNKSDKADANKSGPEQILKLLPGAGK